MTLTEFTLVVGAVVSIFTAVIFPIYLQRRTLNLAREERKRAETKQAEQAERDAAIARLEAATRDEESLRSVNRALREQEAEARRENMELRQRLDQSDSERRRQLRELEEDYNTQLAQAKGRIRDLEDQVLSLRRQLRDYRTPGQ